MSTTPGDPAAPVEKPAKKTAKKTAAAPAKRTPSRTAYLPVLPDGWTVEVIIKHPEGHHATLTGTPGDGGKPLVVFAPADTDVYRRQSVDTLADGMKALGKGAKALDAAAKAQAAAKKAQEDALASLGDLGSDE